MGRSQLFWWLATLLCVAGGVLTKWTGFLFFYAMAIPLLLWQRQFWRLFHWHHLLAAFIGVVVVMAWLGLVIHELGWNQVSGMLWKEGAPRVLHSKNASQQLILETVLHPFKVLGIAAPWSILVLLAWRKGLLTSFSLLEKSLLCWAIAGTVMMTFFPDHNIRQSFSLVPAWTLLGVLAIRRLWQAAAFPSWIQLHPRRSVAMLLGVWILIKLVHVEVMIPARFRERPSLQEQAAIINTFVPPGATLYLVRVKDECLFFHVQPPARRLTGWEKLPGEGTVYCVLTEAERAQLPSSMANRLVHVQPLLDAQGEKMYVLQLHSPSIGVSFEPKDMTVLTNR